MINPRQLVPLLLAMALGSMPSLAQPVPKTKPAGSAQQAPENTAPAQSAPADTASADTASAVRAQAQKNTPPKTGKDSPFDYHSSEQISEDVPVSFPVDI